MADDDLTRLVPPDMVITVGPTLSDDFDWDDPDVEMPTVVDANLDTINRMLYAMDRLTRQVAEYDRLEKIEIERLRKRREACIGSVLRRIEYLRQHVIDFAVQAWRTEKRGRFALPNGTIKSTKVMDVVTVDAETAATWLMKQSADHEQPVWYKPEVDKKATRALLARLEAEGVVKRIVKHGDHEAVVLEPDGPAWTIPFGPDESGHWMIVETGDLVEGIGWAPNGDDGVGRNFQVEL